MENTINIKFSEDYKSFKAGSEYILNGQLIILSGINGAGKSQFLESIKQPFTKVYINGMLISHNNILKYSFRDNINLPTFGTYDYDIEMKTKSIIIEIYKRIKTVYNDYKYYLHDYSEAYEIEFGLKKDTSFENFCDGRVETAITLNNRHGSPYPNSKKVSPSTIAKVFEFLYNPTDEEWLNLSNEEVLNRIPKDFVIKFEDDEVEGITRVFTEAARLRLLERDTYADTTEKFNNEEWLKRAPWTEINNLFEKLNFNYRFDDDYEYIIPYLKEEPKLFAFENGEINRSKERSINDLSDGEKAILKLVVSTYDRKEDNATKLLLLDEYDATLNPSIIDDLYLAIKEYYLDKGIIVIITTHSPITISMAPDFSRYYEIFRQIDTSPIILEVDKSEYQELKMLGEYYEKIKDPSIRLQQIKEENVQLKRKIDKMTKPLIITEGKTDWKHIKKAKQVLKNSDDYEFYQSTDDLGDTAAYKMLQAQSKIFNANKRIFIFDNDNEEIINNVSINGCKFKDWGNNVYSFVLPKPNIRPNENKISIEHYYPDEILKKEVFFDDGIIRRIYSGDEFQTTGFSTKLHKRCNKKDACGKDKIRILSGAGQEKVYDIDKEDKDSPNYALTKDGFFEKVINNPDNIIDMSKFNLILDVIKEIIEQ